MRCYFYILLLVIITSCSRKSEQELLREGHDAFRDMKFELAVNDYQQVVDRSPRTAFAETAQFRIATIYSNDIHDARKAVHAYQVFYSMFPSSVEAPTCLFLTGFLFNNELHLLDSARICYEAFLQKYPNHALAQSATFELTTLGKEPDQFLQSMSANNPQPSKVKKDKKDKK